MASWNHDGTQDPGPPPLMSDPLSGLVTGGKYDAEAVRVRVVEPAAPDIDAVREAMASVLDEDSELMIGMPKAAPKRASAPAGEDMGANDPDAGDGGEGAASAEPAAPPPPTPPAGIPAARIPLPRGTLPPPRRTRTWSPGLAAVGLLLLVIGVLVIVMLASLVDTISSLFS